MHFPTALRTWHSSIRRSASREEYRPCSRAAGIEALARRPTVCGARGRARGSSPLRPERRDQRVERALPALVPRLAWPVAGSRARAGHGSSASTFAIKPRKGSAFVGRPMPRFSARPHRPAPPPAPRPRFTSGSLRLHLCARLTSRLRRQAVGWRSACYAPRQQCDPVSPSGATRAPRPFSHQFHAIRGARRA